MLNLSGVKVERYPFVGVMSLEFEKYERNCTYKQWNWGLLLCIIDSMKGENDRV